MKKIILFVLFSLNNNFIQSAARKPINPLKHQQALQAFKILKIYLRQQGLITEHLILFFRQSEVV